MDVSLLPNDTLKVTCIGNEEINQNIYLIAVTSLRSTWFEPITGSNVQSRLFDPHDAQTAQTLRQDLLQAIKSFETRINVTALNVTLVQDSKLYYVHVAYTVKDSKTQAEFGFNI